MKTYKEFLQDIHYSENTFVLDDDLPDHFDNWLSEQNSDDFMKYGEAYGEYVSNCIVATDGDFKMIQLPDHYKNKTPFICIAGEGYKLNKIK